VERRRVRLAAGARAGSLEAIGLWVAGCLASVPGLGDAGDLDATFGTGGLVLTDFFPGLDTREDRASAVAIQNDGKIVAAGGSYGAYPGPGGLDLALARYLAE
jgi:hypothetical protein